jgi:hypothetical protein
MQCPFPEQFSGQVDSRIILYIGKITQKQEHTLKSLKKQEHTLRSLKKHPKNHSH